ncbi:MAG: site-specific DNA-methyltransferase [Calditrichaeota bacterium]|nr:site-specific DNA-methyltransferase [Calditrichota bacterium]
MFDEHLNSILENIDARHERLPGGWVFNCDNRLVFEALPDDCIDLIITDPPYKDYQSNRPVKHEKVKKILQSDFDLPFFVEQSARVLKPGAHFYCWCDHLTFPTIVGEMQRQKGKWKMENGTKEPCHYLTYKNCLVWVKNNHGSGDLKGNYAPQHEFVIFGCKGERGRRLNGKRPSNIFDARKVSNYRHNHGTTKPVEILQKFIEVSSEEGEVVLDPYAGSMGVGEAAIEIKRYFLLTEIEKEHYNNSIIRSHK